MGAFALADWATEVLGSFSADRRLAGGADLHNALFLIGPALEGVALLESGRMPGRQVRRGRPATNADTPCFITLQNAPCLNILPSS